MYVVSSNSEVICHTFQTLPVEELFMFGPYPTLFPVFTITRFVVINEVGVDLPTMFVSKTKLMKIVL